MTFDLAEYRKKCAVFVYRNDPLDATDALGEALEHIEDLRAANAELTQEVEHWKSDFERDGANFTMKRALSRAEAAEAKVAELEKKLADLKATP